MDFSQLLNQVLGAAQKGGKAVADSRSILSAAVR